VAGASPRPLSEEEISREEAVEALGVDLVDLAERQHTAMLEDLVRGHEAV